MTTRYEQLKPEQLDEAIKKLEKKTTVYLIGFAVFFLMVFLYSMTLHTFFTAFSAMIFMGVLLIYYMVGYTFARITKLMQFDVNSIKDIFDNNENTDIEEIKQKVDDIPEI